MLAELKDYIIALIPVLSSALISVVVKILTSKINNVSKAYEEKLLNCREDQETIMKAVQECTANTNKILEENYKLVEENRKLKYLLANVKQEE